MAYKLSNQKINFNQIVKGKNLQPVLVNDKYKVFDKVIKDKSEEGQKAFFELIKDDSLYSYAFFRDDDGSPFRYTAYQDAIANLHHDFTYDNPNRFVIFKAANQLGKSRLLCGKAAKLVMTEENKNIVLVSKTLPQSQFLLAQIKQTFNNSKFADTWRQDLGDTANTTILTFRFKRDGRDIVNRIICAPAGEGLLGFPVHYLFLDEADFYEDSKTFFWKVAYPRTNKTKGQIILFSNPNPTISRNASLLWELWNGDLFKRKFEFNFLDAPWNTQKEFEIAQRNSPSHIFASTHMGQFSDEGGSFFSYREITDMLQKDWINTLPSVDSPVYIGLDLGKMNDQTILTLGVVRTPENKDDKYKDLDVKYVYAFPLRTDYDIIAERLKEIMDHYKKQHGIGRVGYDATGQKTFGDLLKRMGISAMPVDFAKKESNKTQLYNDFKLMVEKRKIKCVYDRDMEKQLSELVFKLTETKKLKVEAKTENIHDDYPDSLAILIHVSVTPSKAPISVTFVEPKSKENLNKPSTDKDIDKYIARTMIDDRKQYYEEKWIKNGGF